MTRMIGLGVAAALLVPGVAAGQVPDSLTVEQAIQRVVATYPAVAAAAQGLAASQARVRERQSAFDPTVALQGSYARIGPTPPLAFGGTSFNLYPADNWNGFVSVHHTLFDWGRRATAVEEARAQQTSAAETADVVKSGLAYQTVRAFYGVLYLREALAVQDEAIAALTQHLEITQRRAAAGSATDYDVLSTQVRIATARSQRVDITDALAQQTIELRQLLGLPADSAVTPAGSFAESPVALNEDSLIQVALAQRPDLRLSRDAVAAAGVQQTLASLADRPAVSLDLSGGAKNGYVPDLNQIKADFVAGMSVQLPIYNGRRTRFAVEAAEADMAGARARAAALERSVAADVQRAVEAVRASRDKIATADVQVRQARAAVALARTRYQAGVVTNLDVLDAETLLSEAELAQLRARYDLVQGRYELEQAVGVKIW
jgi:outer membrane protein